MIQALDSKPSFRDRNEKTEEFMKQLLVLLAALMSFGAQATPASKPTPQPTPEVINPEAFKIQLTTAMKEVAASQIGSRRAFILNHDRVANSHELARMAEEMGCEVHYFLLHVNIAATNGPTHEDTRD